MERRDFMRGVFGAGVLVATSSLPVRAEDDPSLFPQRGRFERLLLSYATIHIGLEHPFSVMHISDTHLTAAYPYENEKKQTLHKVRMATFGGRQEEALRDSLEWARTHVDYVVHTGDLIDWQSEANYDLVRKYFGENIFGALGNHEFTPNMWLSDVKDERTEAFKRQSTHALSSVYPFDLSFHAQVINGVNFIAIDDVYGTVTPEQVERFDQEAKRKLPMILCMHVPFYTEDLWRCSQRFWNSPEGERFQGGAMEVTGDYEAQLHDATTRDFIARLKQEPLLKGILCGHEHIVMQDRFSPTAMEYVAGGNYLFHAQEILFL